MNKKDYLNTIGKCGCTPLTLAITYKDSILVEQLIKAGADVNKKDADCFPLYLAVLYSFVNQKQNKIFNLLLEAGADINIDVGKRSSLLNLAIINHNICQVRKLIEKGADINKKDFYGDIPIFLAFDELNKYYCPFTKEIINLILAKKPNLTLRNEHGINIFEYIRLYGHIKVLPCIKLLLDSGSLSIKEKEQEIIKTIRFILCSTYNSTYLKAFRFFYLVSLVDINLFTPQEKAKMTKYLYKDDLDE